MNITNFYIRPIIGRFLCRLTPTGRPQSRRRPSLTLTSLILQTRLRRWPPVSRFTFSPYLKCSYGRFYVRVPLFVIFTARCTLAQSAVFGLHVVHLSVWQCLSVTLVDKDHIGWKSWKLITRTISPTSSLFVAQRPSTYSQGNVGKFGGD